MKTLSGRRREFRHSADNPSPAVLERLLNEGGGCSGVAEASPAAGGDLHGRPALQHHLLAYSCS